jgi:acyl dehydratase
MSTPTRHLLSQAPVLGALGRTALFAARQRFGGMGAAAPPQVPGPELRRVAAPLPPDLVRDYVRNVGGDPSAYRGVVPPHLFPQWAFPLAARTLEGLPYPLLGVVNGGCSLRVNHAIPIGEPLDVRARLQSIDDDGRRVVLQQHVVTGTREHPEALVTDFYAIVPLARGGARKGHEAEQGAGKAAGKPAGKALVPGDAREIAYWRLGADAGADFAKLTGDVNPIHWLRPYARAAGFRSVILHGFATLARAYEGLNRAVFAGDVRAIRAIDVRFTRPLVLPARVGLYVTGNRVFVGDAPGGPAYLVGTFETEKRDE